MKKIPLQTLIYCLFAITLTAAGCSKTSSSAPAPLAPAEIPATVSTAFDSAPGPTKDMADTYVSDVQGEDATAAFLALQKLREQHDLSPQQQNVIARATMTTMQQLRAAAESGNKSAQALLHQYISSR